MKIKRLLLILITITLLFTSTSKVFACDEEKTNTYVTQILFGDKALSKQQNNKNVQMLLDALYLCSEQSDGKGQDQLDHLKERKVSGLPSLDALNVSSDSLYKCSHSSWTDLYSPYSPEAKKKTSRKKVLQSTVKNIFGVNFFNQWFGENRLKSERCEYFSELLYYLHILIDYPAESPYDTPLKGKNKKIPQYSGKASIELNGNIPSFTEADIDSFTKSVPYSNFDSLGRPGVASILITPDTVRQIEPREDISGLRPLGFTTVRYDDIVNSHPGYLYNRCHLIAHELTGREVIANLITGTRYMNKEGMQPFENRVAKHVKNNGISVLYRATPIYDGNNQIASGVQLEAYSSDDPDCCFNVFCYNVQPGVGINYADGDSTRLNTVFNQDKVIPFALNGATEEMPDLLFEIKDTLKEVFKGQVDSTTYKSMISEIEKIEGKARAQVQHEPKNVVEKWEAYIRLKPYMDSYLKVLKAFVPFLIQNEEFFKPLVNE